MKSEEFKEVEIVQDLNDRYYQQNIHVIGNPSVNNPVYTPNLPQTSVNPPYNPPDLNPPQHYQAYQLNPSNPNPSYPTPNYPGQNYPGQNYPGQNYPGQNYPTQNYPSQNYPGQNYPMQNYPNQNYSQNNYPQIPVIIAIQGQPPLEINSQDSDVLHKSRIIRYLSLAEGISVLLFLFSFAFLLIFILCMGLGYFGGRNINKRLCIGYCVFLGFIILAKIIVMGFFPFIYVIIIYTLLICYENFQIIYFVKYIKLIYNLDYNDINRLRGLMIQNQHRWFI